jgi:hypothetical protein
MNCIICKDICDKYEGKEWITLKNDNYFDSFKPVVHYCSYLCFHKNKDTLPKDHWKNVLNKEDFDCPLPFYSNRHARQFQYLTYDEYSQMTDTEKCEYDSKKEAQSSLNYDQSVFYEEMYQEEKRVSEMDNVSSDSENDDY